MLIRVRSGQGTDKILRDLSRSMNPVIKLIRARRYFIKPSMVKRLKEKERVKLSRTKVRTS